MQEFENGDRVEVGEYGQGTYIGPDYFPGGESYDDHHVILLDKPVDGDDYTTVYISDIRPMPRTLEQIAEEALLLMKGPAHCGKCHPNHGVCPAVGGVYPCDVAIILAALEEATE